MYMWPNTQKGTSWMSYSEIHFFRFLNREFYDESRNINMLVGSWSFWISKCPKKMGTVLKRHKLSIDVIVTLGLHVHHKIQQINTRYKILQKDITMYLLQLIFFSLFSIYYSSHSSSSISSSNFAPDIFLAFNYTVVSKLSQLKKNTYTQTSDWYISCVV